MRKKYVKTPEHLEKIRLSNLGKKRTAEAKKRMSLAHVGHVPSEQTCLKLSQSLKRQFQLGTRKSNFSTLSFRKAQSARAKKRTGRLHPRWIADRSKLVPRHRKGDWSGDVKRRDNFECVFNKRPEFGPCSGILEAHHILPFATHEPLRYDVDNGVTLCFAHHPRKRKTAESLVPVFQEIVKNKKNLL